MSTRPPRHALSRPPWWLAGDETCEVCHQLHAYGIELRCSGCDSVICDHCAVELRWSSVVHVCPSCAPEFEGV